MEEINIKDFLDYLKKYIPLIIFMMIILVGCTYVYDKMYKRPTYTTYTSIVLVKGDNTAQFVQDNYKQSEAISQNDILLNQNLVSTYGQIIKSKLVLKQVISNLGLNCSVRELSNNIKVEALEDTEIIKISVTDYVPEKAAEIANNISKVFGDEIKKIYKINNISIIDDAQVSYDVSNNTLKRDVLLAVLVSIFGISAIAFIRFYFDDSIKLNENLEKEIGMSVIAQVIRDRSGAELIVKERPNALTSESIRTLRTNLQFASVDKELKTILVTSTLPSEGKSFISSNLAVAFAQAGKSVLLIDCDLRKGRQHKLFSRANRKGLSNLLIGDPGKVNDYIKKTKIKNLSIMTRGVCPPNPSELLNSKKNSYLIEKLSEIYDIVIFDSAPCNGLADSLILSSLVDKVVIVAADKSTPKTELINVRKAIENVGGSIVGCVINNISSRSKAYGKYYYYYEEEE